MAFDTNRLVSFVQRELNARYGLKLTVDGKVGPNTMAALNRVTAIPSHLEKGKRFVAFVQYLTHVEPLVEDIAVDGLYGPATENAMRQLLSVDSTGKVDNWRDAVVDKFAHFDRIRSTRSNYAPWPKYNDLTRFYGDPGKNWVPMTLPYKMKLAWKTDQTISRFSINRKLVEPAQQLFEETLDHYGMDAIEELRLDLWAGCGNVRKMRGGSRYSVHSYAAAIDIDSARNPLRGTKDNSPLARPEYEGFWTAVYRTGAISLLIEKNYDAMHFQWCNL